MSLPLLEYQPTSQNQRVSGFEVGGNQQSRIYSADCLLPGNELDDLIMAAYRQIFNEQQLTESSRQLALESQLRNGQITVREFILGLATSKLFRERNYDTNTNYRFVQMCVQRILGREVYNDREKFAWSTVIATKGLNGFIGDLVNSDEYLENFGDSTVPYQRRRILPQRATGEPTFFHMARYDEFYRANLPEPSEQRFGTREYRWDWQRRTPSPQLLKVGATIIWSGVAVIVFLLLAALFHW